MPGHLTMDVEVRYRWPMISWDFGKVGALVWMWASFFLGDRWIGGAFGCGLRVGPHWSIAHVSRDNAIDAG